MHQSASSKLSLNIADVPDTLLRPVLPTKPKDVRELWAEPCPMVLGPDALGPLAHWERQLHGRERPSIPGWRPEGPGRTPAEAVPMIAWLREHATRSKPFTFNALHLERQGGRSYPYQLQGYDGPLTISRNKFDAAKDNGPRHLLAAIRRDVRDLIRAPQGWTRLEADFETCHGWIAHALTGDLALARDLEQDFHQVTGDALMRDLGLCPHCSRGFGKALNNAMLFGCTPWRVGWLFGQFARRRPLTGWAEQAHAWWWGRYPKVRSFRDQVQELVLQAQVENRGLTVVGPSGRVSKFSSAELCGKVPRGKRPAKAPEAIWRTVFSAVFRTVEGDLLDRTLAHWHAGRDVYGGRLVLPLYDGLLVAAPLRGEAAVATALHTAGHRAATELGIPALNLEVTR